MLLGCEMKLSSDQCKRVVVHKGAAETQEQIILIGKTKSKMLYLICTHTTALLKITTLNNRIFFLLNIGR